jgi:hypothetical protein
MAAVRELAHWSELIQKDDQKGTKRFSHGGLNYINEVTCTVYI